MLDANLKEQLKAYLNYLRQPIHITAQLDASETAQEIRSLLSEIQEASSLVSLSEGTIGERTPAFGIGLPNEAPRVQFAGVPLGHEFTSLVLALLHVSGHPPKVSDEALEQIAKLQGPLNFVTYFSQSCHNCPDVVQAVNMIAARNPGATHVAVDGAVFQSEVESKDILAVPSLWLNGEPFLNGRQELENILDKLDTGGAARRAEVLSTLAPFDILVIGGGPAGTSSAVYAARKGVRTGLLAERMGGQLMDTLSIENFVSVQSTEGPKLAAELEAHVASYGVDIIRNERIASIERKEFLELTTESGATLRARAVILATGARYRDMNIPGEKDYRTKGVTNCHHCDGPLFKGQKVAVIGGGNSGIEAAIDLAGMVEHVTVLEYADTLRADDVLVKKARSLSNIEIICNAQTTEVFGDGAKTQGLRWKNRVTNEEHTTEVAGIFVQIGLLPNTEFLRGSIELCPRGEILVDEKGRTSMPGVFAAGDATNSVYKQIIVAAGDGATAALGAFEYLMLSDVSV